MWYISVSRGNITTETGDINRCGGMVWAISSIASVHVHTCYILGFYMCVYFALCSHTCVILVYFLYVLGLFFIVSVVPFLSFNWAPAMSCALHVAYNSLQITMKRDRCLIGLRSDSFHLCPIYIRIKYMQDSYEHNEYIWSSVKFLLSLWVCASYSILQTIQFTFLWHSHTWTLF